MKFNSRVSAPRIPTGLFPEEVCVAAVMADIAVKHVVGHEGKTCPVEETGS